MTKQNNKPPTPDPLFYLQPVVISFWYTDSLLRPRTASEASFSFKVIGPIFIFSDLQCLTVVKNFPASLLWAGHVGLTLTQEESTYERGNCRRICGSAQEHRRQCLYCVSCQGSQKSPQWEAWALQLEKAHACNEESKCSQK